MEEQYKIRGCPTCGCPNADVGKVNPREAHGLMQAMSTQEQIASEPSPVRYADGAVRDARAPRFDKIPIEGLRRIARRYEKGLRYPNNGDNWKQGGEDFWTDAANHAMEHLALFANGDRSDDHLAAVGWFVTARAWYDARHNDQAYINMVLEKVLAQEQMAAKERNPRKE